MGILTIVPEEGLKQGDVALLIEYLDNPSGGEEGAILEIFNAIGESIRIATVYISAIEALRDQLTINERVEA
jgi:hypothetical protein